MHSFVLLQLRFFCKTHPELIDFLNYKSLLKGEHVYVYISFRSIRLLILTSICKEEALDHPPSSLVELSVVGSLSSLPSSESSAGLFRFSKSTNENTKLSPTDTRINTPTTIYNSCVFSFLTSFSAIEMCSFSPILLFYSLLFFINLFNFIIYLVNCIYILVIISYNRYPHLKFLSKRYFLSFFYFLLRSFSWNEWKWMEIDWKNSFFLSVSDRRNIRIWHFGDLIKI